MDISNAVLSSAINFHRFHEKFSNVIKTSAIGLILLKKEIDNGISEKALAKLVAIGDFRNIWGGLPAWNSPPALHAEAVNGLGSDGIVRVFSAFDVFLEELEGELDSWRSFCRKNPQLQFVEKEMEESSQETDRLFKFLKKENWELKNDEIVRQIYQYYRFGRDCIAHRSGLAGQAFVKISNSKDLEDSVTKWKRKALHKTIIPVRKTKVDERIGFAHQDAIFASDLLRRIALDISSQVITEIGASGLIYLIVKRHILDELPKKHEQLSRTCYGYVAWKLYSEHEVFVSKRPEIAGILKQLGLAKLCYSKYSKYRENQLTKQEKKRRKSL